MNIENIDVKIHNGVNLDEVIPLKEGVLIRTPSMHYTNNYKNFLDENPELTPFVIESQWWEGQIVYLNILYRYRDEVWNRIYMDGHVVLQNRY
jgi:hypothetical protein